MQNIKQALSLNLLAKIFVIKDSVLESIFAKGIIHLSPEAKHNLQSFCAILTQILHVCDLDNLALEKPVELFDNIPC